MAVRRPIVLITGKMKELPAGDSVPGVASPNVGKQYNLTSFNLVVPNDFQYHVVGRLIMDAGSSIKAEGNAQVIVT